MEQPAYTILEVWHRALAAIAALFDESSATSASLRKSLAISITPLPTSTCPHCHIHHRINRDN